MKKIFVTENSLKINRDFDDVERLVHSDESTSTGNSWHKWWLFRTLLLIAILLFVLAYKVYKKNEVENSVQLVQTVEIDIEVKPVDNKFSDLDGWRCFDMTGRCFNIILEPVTWEEAQLKCFQYGATLAVFETEEENDFVGNYLLPFDWQTIYGNDGIRKNVFDNGYWIGYLADFYTLHDYTWQNWGPNEPSYSSQGAIENCAVMYGIEPENGPKIFPRGYSLKWNDMDCVRKVLGYVCMKPSGF